MAVEEGRKCPTPCKKVQGIVREGDVRGNMSGGICPGGMPESPMGRVA